MPLDNITKNAIYNYCNNHLADEAWYEERFEFIQDEYLRKRLVEEFKGTRFAYKIYEGIEAKDENLIFEVRHQILSYATIYEAVLHYVLYNYYNQTQEFNDLLYHYAPARVSIPAQQLNKINALLEHNGESIIPYHLQRRKKQDPEVRFEDKCRTAEQLGIIHKFINEDGKEVDLPSEVIEIFGYRNGIHLIAEQRKGITYELNLSKLAYRRMQPFINQIKERLQADRKGIYES